MGSDFVWQVVTSIFDFTQFYLANKLVVGEICQLDAVFVKLNQIVSF